MSGEPTSATETNSSETQAPTAQGPLAARKIPGQSTTGHATAGQPTPGALATPSAPAPLTAVSSMTAAEQRAELENNEDDDGSSGADGGDEGSGSRPRRNRRGKGPRRRDDRGPEVSSDTRSRVSVPNKRGPLDEDLQRDLEAAMSDADFSQLLKGSAGGQGQLNEGERVRGTVIKIHNDAVFVALGGPHEGVVPIAQLPEPPVPGQAIEVVVRAFSPEDGLYIVVVPGQTIDVQDWSDLQEGAVVEAYVTGVNSGGLEVRVGQVAGFMPAGQVAEHRVEDFSEYVDQRLTCVITESSERRRRLIVSRRAVLEREREERRKEQLAKISIGDTLEGTVRSIKDFGAFVDMGGLEGLVHISRLSWEKVKHPSEVLQEGQKVRVKIEKIDPQSGKIGLSYRDTLDHPWEGIEQRFPVGSTVKGVVTRIANYGAFVKIASGVEGLVHISELAHYKVFKVDNIVKEGAEIEVKVLSIDREAQKISLSLKATIAKPVSESKAKESEPEPDAPPPVPAVKRQHQGPLKGGTDRPSGGESLGLKW